MYAQERLHKHAAAPVQPVKNLSDQGRDARRAGILPAPCRIAGGVAGYGWLLLRRSWWDDYGGKLLLKYWK